MPELPEAETIVRDLRRRILGATIGGVEVIHPDILAPGLTAVKFAERVVSYTIAEVERRGKNVILVLDDNRHVITNLGMTGRLVVSDSPHASQMRHVAIRYTLDDGRALLFDDSRRFGRVAVLDSENFRAWSASLGDEPLSNDFTPERLFEITRGSRTPIRNWLLDQRRIAGVGNIYANEALFRARIRPDRPAKDLRREETDRLHRALRGVLTDAIAARGTTLSDYRDGNGETGGYEPMLQAYGREGEPCPRCGATIERIVLSNRSAFFCPECQL